MKLFFGIVLTIVLFLILKVFMTFEIHDTQPWEVDKNE